MQEIWIQDKHNPDAVRNPFKSYTVAHAHHHCQTRVNRVEDITPEHLAVVDAMNVRHISDWGRADYQNDNPFLDTYIEPSGRDTLKVFPVEQWRCPKCGQNNYPNRHGCRGRGAPCNGERPCVAWKWKTEAGRDAGLADILAQAEKLLPWPSGAGKSMARGAGDGSPHVHADRLDSLINVYRTTRRPRRDLASPRARQDSEPLPSCQECKSVPCTLDCK